ncbi:N-acyl homoserine lactonase family protein [Gelidibacter sp. F2691]|nr:N-acyl homoserine lactonase family protein [Gelidibacter sp. F2691]
MSKEAMPKTAPLISSIQVFSSGWGGQHDEHRFGTWKPRLWWALTSRSWNKIPLSYFLIVHRDGSILFDTGLDPAIATDRNYITSAIGRFLLRRIFQLHITKDDQLDRILAKSGFNARDVRLAVISHLHFDHVGGIAQIPQAKLLVSKREWAQLSQPHPEHEWILKEHIEIPGANWQPFAFQSTDDPLFEGFDGVYDVVGDGSIVLLPTPGHTPGSISMLIRQSGWAPILLVADLTYDPQLLEQDITPGTGDAAELRASFAKVRTLKQRLPDLEIVASHDYGATELISRAVGIPDSALHE